MESFRILALLWFISCFSLGNTSAQASRNYTDLLKTSILFSDNGIRLTGKSPSMTSSGSSGTFNAKWERLTGKSIIDTSRIYYSPIKRTNNPTISDNQFYRTGANIFNMFVSAKYPYLNRSK